MSTRAKWDPAQHPRGPLGRFIDTTGTGRSWNPDRRIVDAQEVLRDRSAGLGAPALAIEKAYKGKTLFAGPSLARGKQDKPDGLNWMERGAVEDYVYSSSINTVLRTGEGMDKSYNRRTIGNLDRTIDKFELRQDVTVYRGSDLNFGEIQPGDQIWDRGYTSTSVNPVVSEVYGLDMMEIELPAGTRAAPVSKINFAEHGPNLEVLVGRGAVFEIDSVEPLERGRRIRARLVGYLEE